MNIKTLVALTLLSILGISTGVYAYSNNLSIQDSYVQVNGSNITITDSNVTITNSTIILGEGNTIIYPSQTPTPNPVNSLPGRGKCFTKLNGPFLLKLNGKTEYLAENHALN